MTLRHIAVVLAVSALGLAALVVAQGERAQADATATSAEVRLKAERTLSGKLRAQLVKTRRAERRWRKAKWPTVDQSIVVASHVYGVSITTMRRIGTCESGLRSWAKNKVSTASGVFQFLDKTWARTPEGRAGLSVWNPVANVFAAARHMSRYGTGAWVCQ